MNKKRLNEISEYLVDMSFIHRNVEHTSELSTEEKMLRELFSEYINLQRKLDQLINFIKMIKNESYQGDITGICETALKEIGE